MSKRDIFGELIEGVAAMKAHRGGKITLRTHKVESSPLPNVDSKLILDTRKKLRCSRAVFARRLRIDERTLEKWEQGRAKPNPQAAALLLLVRRFRIRWRVWMKSRHDRTCLPRRSNLLAVSRFEKRKPEAPG